MLSKEQVYQFKITLKNINPSIWRRIQVPSDFTFWDLHVAIQEVMWWQDCHLHEFRIRTENDKVMNFGFPDDDFEAETLSGWKYMISSFISLVNPIFEYTYDFGDDWRHEVKLEDILPSEGGVIYPRCLDGKRACPPEDCGGPLVYQEFLDVFADPENREFANAKTWVESVKGGPFDPEHFDPAEIEFTDPLKRFQWADIVEYSEVEEL